MDSTVENWRITLPNFKNSFLSNILNKKPKEKECEESESPCCTTCRYVRSKTCGSSSKKLRCQKEPPVVFPSYRSLSSTVRGNGRFCCCALGEFLREASLAVRGDPGARVSESLGQLVDVMLAIANDCVLLLGKIGYTTVDLVKNQSRVYALKVHRKICAYVGRKREQAWVYVGQKRDQAWLYVEKVKDVVTRVLNDTLVEPGFNSSGSKRRRRPKRKKPIAKRSKKKKGKNWKAKNYRL